jgi:4-diphosphocytidyl-2-C-methyl-D-erythritol kinase
VTFFLSGGTALGEGRGERVTPLADAPVAWLVVVVPPLRLGEKTRRMYDALEEGEFSGGERTEELIDHLEAAGSWGEAPLFNVFERAAYQMFEGLTFFRDALVEAGTANVHVCGAGPALFAVTSGEEEARAVRARMTRPRRGEKVHVVRTLTAAEATAVWSEAEAAG